MSRNPDYQFVETSVPDMVSSLLTRYESITGISLAPASPERLFLQWVADALMQERVLQNWTGNQNIPSRAVGENLDALGELCFESARPTAQPATCTMQFVISAAQAHAVLIPSGTRVTDGNAALVWRTLADVYIPAGATDATTQVQCEIEGTIGNDYAIGQINTLVDLFDYYTSCRNITASSAGADDATDDEYYERLRASMDGYSCAGATGSYVYYASRVSTEIADVVANRPEPGHVAIYALMADGTIAPEEMKTTILAEVSADKVRPLTDYVRVCDPSVQKYDVDISYYIHASTTVSASAIELAVQNAVAQFNAWQSAKLGRDINPSYLIQLMMQVDGVKRVEARKPAFTVLSDGSDHTVPQVASADTVTVLSGGYEYD